LRQHFIEFSGKLILMGLGILLAFIMAELGARWLGPPYEIGDQVHRNHQCDPVVGWRGIPNHTTTITMYDRTYPMVWNSTGMRGPDYPVKKESGIFRILILGDSMMEAVEMAEAETSAKILERTLNEQASPNLKFEVINGGIFAWGPPQELMYFRTEGKLYQPDLLLAMWYPGNDLLDVLPNHIMTAGPTGGVHCFAPYFEVCNGQFDSDPWWAAPGLTSTWQRCTQARRWLTSGLNTIYTHSRLYQRLTALFLKVYEKETFSTNLYAPWLDVDRQDARLNEAYQLTAGIYGQLAAEASAAGAKTVVAIAPINRSVDVEVNPASRAAMIAAEPILAQADSYLPHRVLSDLMAAKGVSVFDLQPILVNYLKGGGEGVYWPNQAIHWNVKGNELVGEALAHWLIEQKLVPTK